jgi:hypothetical protein
MQEGDYQKSPSCCIVFAMTRYEILPTEKRLETRTNERLHEVTKMLDTIYDAGETFVPPGLAEQRPDLLAQHTEQLTEIATCLAEKPSGWPWEFAGKAALEGFAFALVVGKAVQPPGTRINIDIGRYANSIPPERRIETMRSDAAHYLGQHACLRGLVETYLPKIDPTGEFTQSTTAITALTMMQIDLSNTNLHIDEIMEEFQTDFDAAS